MPILWSVLLHLPCVHALICVSTGLACRRRSSLFHGSISSTVTNLTSNLSVWPCSLFSCILSRLITVCWVSCGELFRKHGYAFEGRQIYVPTEHALAGTSYSITLVTSLQLDPPFVISNPRTGSNTALDFLNWVQDLLDGLILVAGDFFIVDNASIHYALEIRGDTSFIFGSRSDWILLLCGVQFL